MLSRGLAGLRDKTIIVALPGSPSAAQDGVKVLFPVVNHAFKMLAGQGHKHSHSHDKGRGNESVQSKH